MKKNLDIREAIMEAGLKYWEVAYAYGVADSTFSCKLRKELPPEEKGKLFGIIAQLKEEKTHESAH